MLPRSLEVLRKMFANNKPGFPRPLLDRDGQSTPVPWVGGDFPESGEWARVDTDRAQQADQDELCIVCGEPLGDNWVRLMIYGKWLPYISDLFTRAITGGTPAPLQAHPKCALLAATYCPHLSEQPYPALTLDGEKLTRDQLRALAHERVTA